MRSIAAVLVAAALAPACRASPAAHEDKRVRPPAAAGQFYPAEPAVLAAEVRALMASAPPRLARPSAQGVTQESAPARARIVLAPHAGLQFSGAIAAASFARLDPGFDRAVIVAANHDGRSYFQGFSVDRATHYAVPGLEVKVAAASRDLVTRPGSVDVPGAHGNHMIEIELPFLSEANRGRPFEIVPVIVGELDRQGVRALAAGLAALDAPGTVFVFSVDLSHFHAYDVAVSKDRPCLDAIVAMNAEAVSRCDTDGTQVLLTMVELAARLGATPRLLAYANSGDVSDDRSRVVGYGAIAFEDRLVLTKEEREALLALARASLERAVKEGRPTDIPGEMARFPRLVSDRASFVTLKIGGRLRGCIGSLEARAPLAADVSRNALLAALRDTRFVPVRPEELKRIRVSISVLDSPRPPVSTSPDLLRRLGAEKPGVILEVGDRSSTFLPVVWEELPDPAQFLAALCAKQGSPESCWAGADARFRLYGAEEFGEEKR